MSLEVDNASVERYLVMGLLPGISPKHLDDLMNCSFLGIGKTN